ncbi:MAG: tetratricopeptide repeat protein [Gammaproteobacteria bacterium]
MQRQRAKRYPLRARARIHPIGSSAPARPIEAATRNFSGRGLFLEMDRELSEGSKFHLTLELPSDISPHPVIVNCVSRIVRVVNEVDGCVGIGAVIEQYQSFALADETQALAGEEPRQASHLPKLIAMAEMTFGPKHPDVARSLYNVARLYYCQGRHKEATAVCLRALAIDDSTPGVDVSTVADTLENYARLLRKLERGGEATQMETRVTVMRSQ